MNNTELELKAFVTEIFNGDKKCRKKFSSSDSAFSFGIEVNKIKSETEALWASVIQIYHETTKPKGKYIKQLMDELQAKQEIKTIGISETGIEKVVDNVGEFLTGLKFKCDTDDVNREWQWKRED